MLQERYGAPALTLVGFRLWIHGRQFPQATDESDGNWLMVSVCCETEGAVVWVENDPALEVGDIRRFLRQSVALRAGRKRKASLSTAELMFEAQLVCDRRGTMEIDLEVTRHSTRDDGPHHHHVYHFETTPTYLDRVIDDCERILRQYQSLGDLELTQGAQHRGVRLQLR